MSARALIVAFHCKPGLVSDFIDRANRHAARVQQEPGCIRCDVLKPEAGGTVIYLYELFANEAALSAHSEMPYMPDFVSDAQRMIESRVRTECELVNG